MPLCVTCALLQRAADFTGEFRSSSVALAGKQEVIEGTDRMCLHEYMLVYAMLHGHVHKAV